MKGPLPPVARDEQMLCWTIQQGIDPYNWTFYRLFLEIASCYICSIKRQFAIDIVLLLLLLWEMIWTIVHWLVRGGVFKNAHGLATYHTKMYRCINLQRMTLYVGLRRVPMVFQRKRLTKRDTDQKAVQAARQEVCTKCPYHNKSLHW